MHAIDKAELTRTLNLLPDGGGTPGIDALTPLVYDELRDIAGHYFAKEDADHTLQPTALVHEAYMRMVDLDRIEWQGRTHFFAMGALTMRRILVDHARKRASLKRGGDLQRIPLEDRHVFSRERSVDVLAMEEALQGLENEDPRAAEIVSLRFFGGLTEVEVAKKMGLSRRAVQGEWRMAKAWLRSRLNPDSEKR